MRIAETIEEEGVRDDVSEEWAVSVRVGWGAEKVYAGCCLDKGDLDAVCGSRVSEQDASLGERQRPLGKER